MRRVEPGKILLLLAVLCLVGGSALAEASDPAPRAGAEPPERVLLFIGDSITLGTPMSQPTGPPYPELLAQRIAGPVESLGCPGTSALDWRPRSEQAFPPCRESWRHYQELAKPRLPARVVGVLLGSNDAGGFGEVDLAPVSADDYGWAITQLAGQLLNDGAESVLLMTPPRNFAAEAPALASRLRSYRDEIVRICEASPIDDVHCGPDLYEELGRKFFAKDNFHPNGAAHAWIADEILAWCQSLPPEQRCEPVDDEAD